MFSRKDATEKSGACAGATSIVPATASAPGRRPTASIFQFAVMATAFILPSTALATSALEEKIGALKFQVSEASKTITSLRSNVTVLANKLKATNAQDNAVLVLGTASVTAGKPVTLPLRFLPGPMPTSALQVDLVSNPGVTVTGMSIGLAGSDAKKNIEFATVNGVIRVLIFGVNTNPIGFGVLANITMDTSPALPNGPLTIGLTSPVASDGSGNSQMICGTSGGVTIK